MKPWHLLFIGFCVGGLVSLLTFGVASVFAQSPSQSPQITMPEGPAQAAQRPCMHPAGGWTDITVDNTTAGRSAELNAWSRYVLQCTDDTYVSWGGSAIDADSNDGFLPDGSWYEFTTALDNRYVSVLNVNSDALCRIIECR